MKTRTRWLALLGVLTLALAACGTSATEETAETSAEMAMDTEDTMAMDMDMEGDGHDEGMDHEHGESTEWVGSEVPTIEVLVEGNADAGWTVTANIGDTFQFGSVENMEHEDGVGHAHLIVDGQVIQMLYEPTAAIESLDPGKHMIEISLASGDHSDYTYDGEIISGMAMIEVEGEVVEADVMIMASFEGGAVMTNADRVDVAVGDVVEIMVSSDVAEMIHVHGYDVMMKVSAGGSATLRFTADVPGIFEVELEDSGKLLFELKVS